MERSSISCVLWMETIRNMLIFHMLIYTCIRTGFLVVVLSSLTRFDWLDEKKNISFHTKFRELIK